LGEGGAKITVTRIGGWNEVRRRTVREKTV